jgi:hypothetical protein
MVGYRSHDLAAGCCHYHIYPDDVNAIIPIMCAISYVSYDFQIDPWGAAEDVSTPKQYNKRGILRVSYLRKISGESVCAWAFTFELRD